MSQFGADKFTTRAREAIEAAQLSATTAGNTTTEPIHLLVALLRQAEGTAATLVGKAGVDARRALTAQAESALQSLPRATGATVQQPAASAALTRVLALGAGPGGEHEGRLRRDRAPADRAGRHRERRRRRCWPTPG